MPLTQKRLKELLHYDQDTGIWTWLIPKGPQKRRGDIAGWLNQQGYRNIKIDGKQYYSAVLVHFYMTGKWPLCEMDHKNRIRNDDSWDNLRQATHQKNCVNRIQDRPLYPNLPQGVTIRGKKYEAACKMNGKRYYLGVFSTPEEAHKSYNEFRIKHHGEFA